MNIVDRIGLIIIESLLCYIMLHYLSNLLDYFVIFQ